MSRNVALVGGCRLVCGCVASRPRTTAGDASTSTDLIISLTWIFSSACENTLRRRVKTPCDLGIQSHALELLTEPRSRRNAHRCPTTQQSHVLTVQLSACVQGLLYAGQTNIHKVVTAGNLIAVSSTQASVNS